ncbi:MAG TPA: nicotianamine synthase family protein [Candidatus Saccharimonadales bacterium]|nr:nicotianamine synthase family protein [Candidatus Saccharimonadales bacterium]
MQKNRCVAIYLYMLLSTIKNIKALPSLQPLPKVTALFTKLVSEVVAEPDVTIDEQTCQTIRRLASIAEMQMELFWAKKIIASPTPAKTLLSFPYHSNYRELVRREIVLIEKSGGRLTNGSRVLMVGAGPLPLTSLELAAQRGVCVDHIDVSLSALAMCSLVSNCLGLACGHILGNGASATLTNTYDVVVIAALAGKTVKQKQAIIHNILPRLAQNGRILLRSAYGTRTLLYPGIPATTFSRVTLLEEYHPQDNIINSVFIYKKEEA